ncbi:hypothetical protein CC78DRAFT_535803 [Lojkania enalia]|uniref:Uncharacterized protein n=1 Tax=Lojkania enalia TaxID=147567 RepID=A0A9P4K858_9PLEO|nr:hypothetical protein CC78DRAFT_535803 [Didymosphaeria enalia]
MRTTILLVTLFAASALTFNITLHQNTACEGTVKVFDNLKLEDGCQKVEAVNSQAGGISVQWTETLDNELSIAFFSNENCCNGGPSGSRGWGVDECTSLGDVLSFRIMDGSDINKGKEGEKYECRNSPDDPPPPEALTA